MSKFITELWFFYKYWQCYKKYTIEYNIIKMPFCAETITQMKLKQMLL